MNKVILVGNLTRDPDVRVFPATQKSATQKEVTTFTLAVNRFTGQGQKEVDFIPIVTWDSVARNCGDHLTKGQKVLVEGRLRVRSYEDKTGQKRWVTEVVAQTVEFLERRAGQPAGGEDAGAPPQEKEGRSAFGVEIYPDDDVPF